jgi:GTP cyclohydrolase I
MMEDVQSRSDHRGIAIDKVGVMDLHYPIVVLDQNNDRQHTVATLSLSVNLPHHFKGTHMSRFIEVLNEHRGELTMRTLPGMLRDLKSRLDAESAHIEVDFPYFVERAAPVTGARALIDFECSFVGSLNGNSDDFVLKVRTPVTSLCPCSKEISKYGAHNQRGFITIQVRTGRESNGVPQLIWIEELVAIADASASAPVYPLLKRSDEKRVTEQAWENPVFVEDMVRNAAQVLSSDERVTWFRVGAVNQESIHNHSAFAELEWSRE